MIWPYCEGRKLFFKPENFLSQMCGVVLTRFCHVAVLWIHCVVDACDFLNNGLERNIINIDFCLKLWVTWFDLEQIRDKTMKNVKIIVMKLFEAFTWNCFEVCQWTDKTRYWARSKYSNYNHICDNHKFLIHEIRHQYPTEESLIIT